MARKWNARQRVILFFWTRNEKGGKVPARRNSTVIMIIIIKGKDDRPSLTKTDSNKMKTDHTG